MNNFENYIPNCFKTEEYCETNMICKQCRQYPNCGKDELKFKKIKRRN